MRTETVGVYESDDLDRAHVDVVANYVDAPRRAAFELLQVRP
jgi:hypothetical protein